MYTETSSKQSTLGPMMIIGALFFIFGFVTWLNGPLITFVKLAFNLDDYSKAFMVTTAFYMAYFFLALPSSWILEKTGMKKGMAMGLFVMAIGTFVFGTYATQRHYNLSLTGLFIIGAGLSLLQTAVNPYISILGPIETAARRISIMGICNKVAGILSPLVIGALVFKGMGDLSALVAAAPSAVEKERLLNEFAGRIYLPYMIMAGILALLAVWVTKSALPEINASEVNSSPEELPGTKTKTSVFQFPHLMLGVLCLFLYVGVEVMAGDAIGVYAQRFHVPADKASMLTSFTLATMLVGYIIGLLSIPKLMSQEQALKLSAISGILFSIGAYFTTGTTSIVFVGLLGLSNALMWPAIFPLAISGLGKFTEKGSALLIMGIAGGAIIPQIYASFQHKMDFQLLFLILMGFCYVYILYYATTGFRVGLKKKN